MGHEEASCVGRHRHPDTTPDRTEILCTAIVDVESGQTTLVRVIVIVDDDDVTGSRNPHRRKEGLAGRAQRFTGLQILRIPKEEELVVEMDDEIVATRLPGEIEAPGIDGRVGREFPLGGEDVEARTSWARPQRGDIGPISAPREEEVRSPSADRERVVAGGDDDRPSGRRRHERDRPVTGARPGGLGCDTAREDRSDDGARRIGDNHPLKSPDRQLPGDRRRVGR